jgi:hypothetical protein
MSFDIGDIVMRDTELYIVHGCSKDDDWYNLWALVAGSDLLCVSGKLLKLVQAQPYTLHEPDYKFDDVVVFQGRDFVRVARLGDYAGPTSFGLQEAYNGRYLTVQRRDILYMAPPGLREAFVQRWNSDVENEIAKKRKELEDLEADFL